jgi:Na+/H+ antiporter NhaD/arsenite permease-like protein
VAFLVGTNVAAMLTPHGSVATMLARSTARAGGERTSTIRYLRTGWRYAVPSSIAAVAAILVVR